MISSLNKKLLRELVAAKTQNFAIAAVIASGVAVFVMALGVLSFLQSTRDAYYDRYQFGDVFASLVRAPQPVAEQLAMIPGVSRVQHRIVTDVTLDVPGLAEPAVGRLVSLPRSGQPVLNRVFVVSGRLPEPHRFGEVLAGQSFVEANQLELGDEISAIINGRFQKLRIVGVGISPEYVFQIRGGDILPDDRRFGVFWMGREGLEAALDMKGAFNDVSLKLLRGTRDVEVIDRLDAILQPYGGVGGIPRADQVSAKFLNDEIKQLRATGIVAPVIFLGVAAFLLNIVLTRKIMAERETIAALRAFGYTRYEIAWHYLKSALAVTVAGALLGSVGGYFMGSGLARLYAEFYRFPEFIYRPDWMVFLPATAISLLAAVLGTVRAIWSVLQLRPAEAMRPPAPARYRPAWIERWGLGFLLPLSGRMIIRQLSRRAIASLLATIGIACAVSVMLLSAFAPDALDYLIHFQFELAQRQDVQVVLKEEQTSAVNFDFEKLPGVQAVEPFRAVPVDLKFKHRGHRTSILGLSDRRELYRLLNDQGRPIRLPPGGVVLSEQLAKILAVQAGDTVRAQVLTGEKQQVELKVGAVVAEFAGTNAYMRTENLDRMLGEGQRVSGVFLAVDSRRSDLLYQKLKRLPAVASVSVKRSAIDQFRDTIAENTLKMQSFTIFFASVIAVGVVYNTARISLDERARELATMRVIGFTRTEISILLLGELAVLTIAAIPLGWLLGYAFCWAMVAGFESDNFRIPLVLERSSFAMSAIVTMLASLASGLLVRRRLDRLDLVEVLKSR